MKTKESASKGKKKFQQRIKKTKRTRAIAWIGFSFIALFFFVWLTFQIMRLGTNAAANSWVDNSRDLLRTSRWFLAHDYRDCPNTNGGYWPPYKLDCLFGEPGPGPSVADLNFVKDPSGLYYKHFLPTDFVRIAPRLIAGLDLSTLKATTLEGELSLAIQQNPLAFANISVSSLDLGMEGGNNGTIIRSLSLYVHPLLERPIANRIGTLQRARNIFKPFIEGATGGTISDNDLNQLYTAALNRCGDYAINNDQSGQGVYKIIGSDVVIVQNWHAGIDRDIGRNDCNIHVAKIPTGPTPSVVTPTFSCLGSAACVPTVTVSPSPTMPLDVTTPTPEISVPVASISATPTPSTTPPSVQKKSIIIVLLNLLKLIVEFMLQLLGRGGDHNGF